MTLDALSTTASLFHFIRPWWLAGFPAVGLIWWLIRRAATRGVALPPVIAPHLAAALTVNRNERKTILPIDGVAVLLGLVTLAAAGPTWSRVPNPLVADTAPVVIALKVSKSMMQTNLPPSRLERSKHKVRDLIGERAGAKTALVAYAATAHQVVPPTEDPDVLTPFLEGLSPEVMPRDGEAARNALQMASAILETQSSPGAIIFLLDRITDADKKAFSDHAQSDGAPVIFWFAGRDTAARDTLVAVEGATVIDISPDKGDVAQVMRNVEAAYQQALAGDDRQKWNDEGWIFAWPAALLALFWFRKGWTMRWSAAVIAIVLVLPTDDARAEGWRDWFFTPDQQGMRAFEAKEFQRAADLFEDPMWQAYSLYKSGKYEEAAEIYAWQDSSDAAVGEGLSLIRSRSYRPAIAAFEKALERDPDNAIAAHNLELARYILDYVETTREQSDTGEEAGIGADDVVYDNEAGRGADSEQQASSGETTPETAEQWMRTVDTRTGDFLKSRFALEAARAPQ